MFHPKGNVCLGCCSSHDDGQAQRRLEAGSGCCHHVDSPPSRSGSQGIRHFKLGTLRMQPYLRAWSSRTRGFGGRRRIGRQPRRACVGRGILAFFSFPPHRHESRVEVVSRGERRAEQCTWRTGVHYQTCDGAEMSVCSPKRRGDTLGLLHGTCRRPYLRPASVVGQRLVALACLPGTVRRYSIPVSLDLKTATALETNRSPSGPPSIALPARILRTPSRQPGVRLELAGTCYQETRQELPAERISA